MIRANVPAMSAPLWSTEPGRWQRMSDSTIQISHERIISAAVAISRVDDEPDRILAEIPPGGLAVGEARALAADLLAASDLIDPKEVTQ